MCLQKTSNLAVKKCHHTEVWCDDCNGDGSPKHLQDSFFILSLFIHFNVFLDSVAICQ